MKTRGPGGLHHVDISTPGLSGIGTVVELDGVPVKGVTRIELVIGMNEPNRLTLELYVEGVNAGADVMGEDNET